MLEQKAYNEKIAVVLQESKHIEHEGCDLYLVNTQTLSKIKEIEDEINTVSLYGDEDKKGVFYHFGKIINPDYPAIKFNLKKRHKYRATFDREKIRKELVRDKSILAHRLKNELEERIFEDKEEKYTKESAELARKELDKRIEIDLQMIEEVSQNFEKHDIIITNFESYLIYPYIYYTYVNEKEKGLGVNEYLRSKVPNILWVDIDEYHKNRRKDEKINEMIQTHTRLLGSFYVRKKDN